MVLARVQLVRCDVPRRENEAHGGETLEYKGRKVKITTEEAMKNPVLKAAIEGTLKAPSAAQTAKSMLQGVNPAFPLAKAKGRAKPRGTMNKLEESFSRYLESEKQAGRVLNWSFESETFKIGHDCRYTPDFACLMAGHFESYFEVKGPHAWEDSLIKLKVVAAKWWWRTFHLCRRNKDGTWKIVEVKAA